MKYDPYATKNVDRDHLESTIQEIQRLRRRKRYSSSKLNKHLHEIFILYFEQNVSYSDIAHWLRVNKRCKVTRQSVAKFIDRHITALVESGNFPAANQVDK